MNKIEFYYMPGSPPCAFVALTAAALGIHDNLFYHITDMREKAHLTDHFLKINPQHTTPVIVDKGFTLWESRAICTYLVAMYGKEKHKKLYPEDLKTRAVIDQRLDFDLGTLYARFYEYFYTQFIDGSPLNAARYKMLQEALGFFNTFLEGNEFAVGSNMTLADLNIAVTIEILRISDISVKQYPNIVRWFELVKRTAPMFDNIMKRNGKEHNEVLDFFREATVNEREERERRQNVKS